MPHVDGIGLIRENLSERRELRCPGIGPLREHVGPIQREPDAVIEPRGKIELPFDGRPGLYELHETLNVNENKIRHGDVVKGAASDPSVTKVVVEGSERGPRTGTDGVCRV